MKKQRCKDSKTSARKGQKESGSQLVLLVLHGGTCQTALGFIPTAAFFSELKSSRNQMACMIHQLPYLMELDTKKVQSNDHAGSVIYFLFCILQEYLNRILFKAMPASIFKLRPC